MSQKPRPGYYAVIPADVRYDDKLPPNAKLLYGEISALLNDEGYCFASNQYFADLFQVTARTITDLVARLQERGHIRVDVIRNDKGKVIRREIRCAVSLSRAHPVEENFYTPRKSFLEGIEKNFQYTNTSITNLNGKEDSPAAVSPGETKPQKGKSDPKPSYELDDDQMQELIRQNVGTLGDTNGWDRNDKNAVYKLVLEFYAPRAIDGKPPKHTARGVNGLFRKLAPGGKCSAPTAAEMLLEAIERGWTSVYPRADRQSPRPAGPPPDHSEGGIYKCL